MRSVKIALAAGVTLLAIAIGLTLASSPMTVAATDKVHGEGREPTTIAGTRQRVSFCQMGETLPHGTSAVRLSLGASIGPRVRVVVDSRGRPITGGEEESAWTGWVVTVPVKPLPATVSRVAVCVSFQARNETVALLGRTTSSAIAAREGSQPLPGRMWVEFLRPGARSWASLASSIVRNMGFGRAYGGVGIVLLAFALLVALAALTLRAVLMDPR